MFQFIKQYIDIIVAVGVAASILIPLISGLLKYMKKDKNTTTNNVNKNKTNIKGDNNEVTIGSNIKKK